MTREAKDELIWLYAAGALGEAELQTVRALLEEGDAEDLSSLAAARETLARLPEALDGNEPSDAVLKRLMRRVDAKDESSSPISASRSSRWWMLPTLITAAAACVAVVSLLQAMNLRDENKRLEDQIAQSLSTLESGRSQAATQVAQLQAELAAQQVASAKKADELTTQMSAQEVASAKKLEELTAQMAAQQVASSTKLDELTAQMSAQQIASAKKLDELIAQNSLLYQANLQFTALEKQNLPRGGGRVVWDVANRKANVFVFDLAPPAQGKVYELWFIEGGAGKAPVPAGTFTVDAKGNGLYVATIPEGMDNIQVAAITEEPAGGSATPTMPIKLMGTRTQ